MSDRVTIYIGDLPSNITPIQLKNLIEQELGVEIGPVDLKGAPKRYCFVQVIDPSLNLDECMKRLHDLTSDPYGFRVEIPNGNGPVRQRESLRNVLPGDTLFLVGFNPDVHEEILKDLVSSHGRIKNYKLTQKPGDRGTFFHVQFETDNEARMAREALNLTNFEGTTLHVEYAQTRPWYPSSMKSYNDIRKGYHDYRGRRDRSPRRDYRKDAYDFYERGFERMYYDRNYDRLYDRGAPYARERGYEKDFDRSYIRNPPPYRR